MSTAIAPWPASAGIPAPPVSPSAGPSAGLLSRLKRYTVDEYDQLVESGVFTEHDNLVLIENFLVHRDMSHNPPHDGAVYALHDLIRDLRPDGWVARAQMVLALPDSRPEPDLVVARGDRRTYFTRHPTPADLGFVVEVADSSLADDQIDSQRIYARAGVPVYWIVNIPDRQVEVYTDPDPAADPPAYRARRAYRPGDAVPVVLDGVTVGTVAVSDVLP